MQSPASLFATILLPSDLLDYDALMKKLLQGDELARKAEEYGIPTTRYDNNTGIARRARDEELQQLVREFERDQEAIRREQESSVRERKLFTIALLEALATAGALVVAILALVLKR